MKLVPILFTAAVAAATAVPAAAFDVEAATKALKDNNCTKCHSVDKAKKGPAYQKVAAKYKGKADAEATMFKFVTDPNGDHPEYKGKPEDAKAVIKWILQQ